MSSKTIRAAVLGPKGLLSSEDAAVAQTFLIPTEGMQVGRWIFFPWTETERRMFLLFVAESMESGESAPTGDKG